MTFQRILCPVDFSSVVRFGIRPAASLASRYGAKLILAHVIEYPPASLEVLVPGSEQAGIGNEQVNAAHARLEQLAEEELDPSIVRDLVVRIGTPHTEIVEVASETKVDLIVLPTRSISLLERWFLGNTANKVIRNAPCAVLSIPPSGAGACTFNPFKILFATDFSEFADQALPWALSLAQRYDCELLMVHVTTVYESDPASPRWRFPGLPDEYIKAVEDEETKRLEARAERGVAQRVSVDTRMLRGIEPAIRIVDCAREEHADLVVLATHGRTGLAHVLLGSTAERVVHCARCPVLTVRHPKQLRARLASHFEEGGTRPFEQDQQEEEHPPWSVPPGHIGHHP
jgi:nucleotide-binding universal stress UspA family protein